jgi:pimeloyl-ACP methyl ester carboxylesterase
LFAPSIANDPASRDGWARYLRSAATPGTIKGIFEVLRDIDVRGILGEIRCPTLVIHRKDEKLIRASAGADLAQRIPGARYVELEGQDHWWFVGDSRAVLNAIQSFLDEI